MTSIVTILAPSESVKANSEGLAELAFSITNITAGRLAVGAQILVDAPAEERWFSIEGATKRELAANETDQVIVKAKLPLDAKPGEYKFRLQVYSTERGRAGEDFTNGPTVAVEKPESTILKPDNGGDRKWLWIAIAAAVVLVLGGLATWLFWPKTPEVPNLVGLPLQEAVDQLKEAKLAAGEVREELTGQASGGTVAAQTPEPGTAVDKWTKVDLVIEALSIEVPILSGKNVTEARETLKTAGLAVGEVASERTGEAPGGMVLRMDPPAGTRVLPQTPVNLVVEAESVAVPRLIGQTLGEATQTLRGRNLAVGQITQRRTGATPGVVLNQSPAEGEPVAPGSTVALTVEQQTIQVPALTNMLIEQAARKLSDEGLGLGIVTKAREGKIPGTVLTQDPVAGASVEPGRQIALVIEDQPLPPAQAYKSGRFSVRQTWSGDLDQGTESSTGADFWFEAVTATERYLVPRNNATMAVVGRQSVGRDGCAKASLSTGRIPITSVPAGTYVCVRTSEGRYSEFTVLSDVGPSPGTLQIAYTTWVNPLVKPMIPIPLDRLKLDMKNLRVTP